MTETMQPIKPYKLYLRMTRQTPWDFSDYLGRFESKEDALRYAREYMSGRRAEYRIRHVNTGEHEDGYI